MRKNIMKNIIIFLLIAMILSGCVIEDEYNVINPETTTSPEITHQHTPTITPKVTFEINESYVVENGTRVYKEASQTSQIAGVLHSGDIVKLVDEAKEFFYIECGSLNGYIKWDDLTISPTKYTAINLDGYEFSSPNIVVIKSLHILELWDCDTLIFTCTAQIGQNEEGDKEILGDTKTPEGEYYLCTLNPSSKYYRGIYISYPNEEDALQAYEEGTIDENTKDTIIQSAGTLSPPPFDTPLGGFISIHGEPDEQGYTAGCIAIPNEYMDILWQYCPLGTKVTILP